jgi:nicotinamidase-related amidase
MAGLWTEVCLAEMALSALDTGYEVYILVDVSGGVSPVTHDAAVQRLVQAGAVPVTWLAVMSEWQRDYTRAETLAAFADIGQAHGGPIALGVNLFEARGGGN